MHQRLVWCKRQSASMECLGVNARTDADVCVVAEVTVSKRATRPGVSSSSSGTPSTR